MQALPAASVVKLQCPVVVSQTAVVQELPSSQSAFVVHAVVKGTAEAVVMSQRTPPVIV